MYNELRKIRLQKKVKADILSNLINKTTNVYYKKERGMIPFTIEEAKIISKYFKKSIEKIFN